ncbi:MAG: hypothetical protein A4E53_04573 [Pelotomaculum sp. PtaB.Bin104]|nr:MAG: hypothetical protein A4E53_04573 [Pelotomaculum sp. PtaB.Bin104]
MSEEKEILKERLVAIMKYSKKSKVTVLMSMALLVAVISGAVMLGGCIGKTNQDVLYENDKFGFALLIPKDFMDTVEIKEMGDRVFFVNKEIQAMHPEHNFGVVGRIEVYAKKAEFTRENMKPYEDAYGLRYLGENEKYYFGWAHSTDVQYPPESLQLKEQFRTMEGKFNEIIKSFKIINTSGFNLTNELEEIKDNFYESVNYDPGQGLLKFTIPKTIPEGYRFYLHVGGCMYMGDKSNGMSFHAFDEESQNYSWENGKTYTYPLKSDSLDECLLVFGWTDKNNRELLYTIHIYPNGTKSYGDPKKILVFIKDYDEKARMLTFDEIEWILQSDTKRINELGLDANLDFPNGYYIYNESEREKSLKVTDDVKVYIVNWSDLANPLLTDVSGLTKRMAEHGAPYHLTIKDGVIIEILEQYRP